MHASVQECNSLNKVPSTYIMLLYFYTVIYKIIICNYFRLSRWRCHSKVILSPFIITYLSSQYILLYLPNTDTIDKDKYI